jgi:hypothetical protein
MSGENIHFLVAAIKRSDTVALFFSPKPVGDSDLRSTITVSNRRRYWRLLPGESQWSDETWESPAWRCGQCDLDIMIRVTRSDGRNLDLFTDEASAFDATEHSGARLLIEVPAPPSALTMNPTANRLLLALS